MQQFAQVQNIFNRQVKRMQRDRAASAPDASKFDYLRNEVAERLLDRLDVCGEKKGAGGVEMI